MSIKKRASGILLGVSSLPSKSGGIGKLGEGAKKFIDFLSDTKTKYWQVLPLSQTSFGDSPYQSFSIHAGNPYFIDFEILKSQGLLQKSDINLDFGSDSRKVDYEKVYFNTYKVLRKAFERFKPDSNYINFCRENEFWLDDYALFMALKDSHKGAPWYMWEKPLAMFEPSAVKTAAIKREKDAQFYKFVQYEFFCQWENIKKYANSKGVEIIGDMPIYVALDSVEAWTRPQFFEFDEEKKPKRVAGCPPDVFSPTGQLWGNPLYDWDFMKKDNYSFWKERIEAAKVFYDVLRIDHFRGFESYYAIGANEKTAEVGTWEKGPGMDLFSSISSALNGIEVIAEDLGFVTPEVKKLLADTKYPGMKVLQFAYGGDAKSDYLPCNFKSPNCIVYTGTHDNDTLQNFIKTCDKTSINFMKRYLNINKKSKLADAVIRSAWESTAQIAVAQMQDFLPAKNAVRMNTPSTLGGNWEFRIKLKDLNQKTADKIRELNDVYNR